MWNVDMKPDKQHDVYEALLSFLQLELHIHDRSIQTQIADSLFEKNAVILNDAAHPNKLKYIKNAALIHFNEALIRHFKYEQTGVITAARAQLLSQQQCNDFLFNNTPHENTLFAPLSATPEEAPLTMPTQRLVFFMEKDA
jgi:hypothetical protein